MIKIIGTKGCTKCKIVKQQLDKDNIEYKYVLLEELSEDEYDFYINLAKTKGVFGLPLIIRDGELVEVNKILQEMI